MDAAIDLGWKSAMDFMLKNGSKGVNINNAAFLNSAAMFNNREKVQILLEKGFNINAQDEFKHSPIHVATLFDHKDMVEFLIQNGADVNQRSEFDHTIALHHAAVC